MYEDYEELVKRLRYCAISDNQCSECKYHGGSPDGSKMCLDVLMEDAANALEELSKRVEGLEAAQEISPEAQHFIDAKADNIIDGLQNLLASVKERPRWIPVTERLPEMYQPVLTFDGKLHAVEMRVPYILDGDGEQIESDWWVEADNDIDAEYYRGLRDGAATYWMPLPEPPKEEA